MAGPQPAEMPDDRSAGEIKVAQRIDQLVADKLVGKAQPAIIQHPVPADHNGVVERAAARQPGSLETRPIVEQPEGAGGGKLGLEGAGLEIERDVLPADKRVVEIDLKAH